jgi:hypothetical protein
MFFVLGCAVAHEWGEGCQDLIGLLSAVAHSLPSNPAQDGQNA